MLLASGCTGGLLGPSTEAWKDDCASLESHDRVPVPDPPKAFTNESAAAFVGEYVRATNVNGFVGEPFEDVTVGVEG